MLIHSVRLIRVFPQAWLTKYTVFTFLFPDSGSLIWILPSDYSDSKQYSTGYDWPFLSQLELLNKWITAVSTVDIPNPRRSCSWTYKINELLVSPNERLNNIIFERTLVYNSYPASKFHVKRIQFYLWARGTWRERPKSTWPTQVLTCSSQVITCLSYGTSLLVWP